MAVMKFVLLSKNLSSHITKSTMAQMDSRQGSNFWMRTTQITCWFLHFFSSKYKHIFFSQHSRIQLSACGTQLNLSCIRTGTVWSLKVLIIIYISSESYRMYLRTSHNVLNQEYFAANRASRISHGAMDIVVALSRLPATIHLMDTFVVDVFLVSATLLGFTLHGTFRDGPSAIKPENTEEHDNYFTRTFMVAPRGEGKVAIVSDQLFISSMSKRRGDQYRMLVETATDIDQWKLYIFIHLNGILFVFLCLVSDHILLPTPSMFFFVSTFYSYLLIFIFKNYLYGTMSNRSL